MALSCHHAQTYKEAVSCSTDRRHAVEAKFIKGSINMNYKRESDKKKQREGNYSTAGRSCSPEVSVALVERKSAIKSFGYRWKRDFITLCKALSYWLFGVQ